MKLTQNISVAGFAFVAEQDAADSLEKYLNELDSACGTDPSRKEILSDIEYRIAELLKEVKGCSEVITCDMVSYVRMRIGEPSVLSDAEATIGAEEKAGGNAGGKSSEKTEDKTASSSKPVGKHRLYRDLDGKNIAGVCSGLAWYFNLDVALVRIIWTALFIGGAFVWNGNPCAIIFLSYFIFWICTPAARTVEQKCEMKRQPLDLDQFSQYPPATPQSSYASVASRRKRPLVLNILCFCLGITLLLGGIGCLVGSAVMPFIPSVLEKDHYVQISSEITQEINDAIDEETEEGHYDSPSLVERWGINGKALTPEQAESFFGPAFWWILFAFLLSLGLILCYFSLMLMLGFKAPSWHPGIILLVVNLLSLIGIVVYCVQWCSVSNAFVI